MRHEMKRLIRTDCHLDDFHIVPIRQPAPTGDADMTGREILAQSAQTS